MKKIFMWSLLAFAAGALSACGGDDKPEPGPNPDDPRPKADYYLENPTHSRSSYIVDYPLEGATMFNFIFSDIPMVDSEQGITFEGDGSAVQFTLISAPAVKGELAPGVYNTTSSVNLNKPGVCITDNSGYFQIEGSEMLGSAKFRSGKVTVTKEADVYTISFLMTLADSEVLGVTQKLYFEYVGKLQSEETFNYISTLTEDIEIELEGYPCAITYVGKVFDLTSIGIDNSDSWVLEIVGDKAADGSSPGGITLMTISPAAGYEAGFPIEAYTASIYYPAPGATESDPGNPYVIAPGEIVDNSIFPSMYLGPIVNNTVSDLAPFYSGDVAITKEEDGSYMVDFEVIDDNPVEPHTMTGTWIGVPTIKDGTKNNAPAFAPVKVEQAPQMQRAIVRI